MLDAVCCGRLKASVGSWPCLNQIECHLLCKRTDIVKFCRERNIVVMAYGVLGSRESALLELPEVQEMALHHSCSCGAVLLAWAAAKEIVVVFGSTSERHIAENLSENQVVLSVDEIRILDSLEEKKVSPIDCLVCFSHSVAGHFCVWVERVD